MIVISDSNVLSSLAAGNALLALLHLFKRETIVIPPGVEQELQLGLDRGKLYLEPVFQAITDQQIAVIDLSAHELLLIQTYPHTLNRGECVAIALAQTRKTTLLCSDKRAIRYCQQQGSEAVNLVSILRLLWVRKILTQREVRIVIQQME